MRVRKLLSKAQISVEYVLIVGFALSLTLPLLLIFNNQSQEINTQVTDAQVNKVADEVITAVDSVYYLGPPSSKTVKVYLPSNVKSITFDNTSLTFKVSSPNGPYDVVRWAATQIDSSGIRQRNASEGIYVFLITANPTNVSITDAP